MHILVKVHMNISGQGKKDDITTPQKEVFLCLI